MMIEGSGSGSRARSGSGSIHLTSGSGSRSWRPKNTWIRWIRIRIRIRICNTGSAESPTADFLLDWLKGSRSDPRRCAASLTCRPQVETQLKPLFFYGRRLPYCTGCLYRPDMPKYMRMSKLLAAAHIFTNSFENSQILSWLLSVLSLSRKFVHDHCCCPKSAIILTASKMEAILDFWRGFQNLSQV